MAREASSVPDTTGWDVNDVRNWFNEAVRPTELWKAIENCHSEYVDGIERDERVWRRERLEKVVRDKRAVQAIMALAPYSPVDTIPRVNEIWTLISARFLGEYEDWSLAFGRLHADDRQRFVEEFLAALDRWNNPPPEPVDDEEAEASSEFDDRFWVNITLPNGRILTIADADLELEPTRPSEPTETTGTAEPARTTASTAPAPPVQAAPPPELPPLVGEVAPTPGPKPFVAATPGAEPDQAPEEDSILPELQDTTGREKRPVKLFIGLGFGALALIGAVVIALNVGDDDADEPSLSADPGVDEPGDSVSAVPDPPVVGDPCSFVDIGEVQAITGTPHSPSYTAPASGNRHVCFLQGETATGDPFLQIELQRSTDSNSYATFTDAFPDESVTVLDWPTGGIAEVRAGHGFAVLWAELIPPDALGRVVQIQVNLGNAHDLGTGLSLELSDVTVAIGEATSQVEAVGVLLRDGVLAAQPA